jgi:hypothetical protein
LRHGLDFKEEIEKGTEKRTTERNNILDLFPLFFFLENQIS